MHSDIEATSHSSPLASLPAVGHREYWYPILKAKEIGKALVPIRILGEDIVLLRSGEEIAALVDRCPHRGARLSLGRVIFPGTLSCGYHGWTFNAQGECLAAILEGPESKLPGKVHVQCYPTEVRFGVLWIFMGEGKPPPLEEDLPPPLRDPKATCRFMFSEWDCNWRLVTDNYADMAHGPYVHRTSLKLLFARLPAWGKMVAKPLSDGKGLFVAMVGSDLQSEYPGLGKFPAHMWWRVVGGGRPGKTAESTGSAPFGAELRMPGYLVLRLRDDPIFRVEYFNVGWPVPIDEGRIRFVNINITYPKKAIHKLALGLWYRFYFRPLQTQFLSQDKRLIESQNAASEKLSLTDIGVIQWRTLAARLARDRQARRNVPDQ